MAGLYLHIPFCLRKCSYCDFFSVAETDAWLEIYPDLLIKQLKQAASRWTEQFDTVYFGGGTPSLLSPAALARILQTIDREVLLSKTAEVTLEANPGTVTRQTLAGYRQAGVNRLSLGLQSSSDQQLSKLGRLHSSSQGRDAVAWARAEGFDNLSLDLMFALPGQTVPALEEELQSFLDLRPEHFSCYGLTAEDDTPLQFQIAAGETSLPDEEFYADAFMLIHDRLSAAGYEHYEIANYARAGRHCQHNLGYWNRRPYLGLGAGAHSFYPEHWGSRWEVPADLDAYQHDLEHGLEPLRCLEKFDRSAALRETIYLALRTRHGVSDRELQECFDTTLPEAFPEALAASKPWLSRTDNRWAFSPEGWLLFDHLILPFL